jgi:hypothetical protein
MSIVVNGARFNGRIDCIDWEGSFVDTESVRNRGFHRHLWDPKIMSCESLKMALPRFLPSSAEAFIIEGLLLLKVKMREEGK